MPRSYILVLLQFQPEIYGSLVAKILSLGNAGNGARPMELFPQRCSDENVRVMLLKANSVDLFRGARDPDAALSGLFLYFSCLKESHDLLHSFNSMDGAYWHAIMHRMEGDGGNARYWFHRVPGHPVYAQLQRHAAQLGYENSGRWDSFAFASFCEAAPGTANEGLAKNVQLAEWQLLFEYCAAPMRAVADERVGSV